MQSLQMKPKLNCLFILVCYKHMEGICIIYDSRNNDQHRDNLRLRKIFFYCKTVNVTITPKDKHPMNINLWTHNYGNKD